MRTSLYSLLNPAAWLLSVLLAGGPALADGRIEVYEPRHVPAAELVGTVRPLLGEGASVSAFQGRLVVQAAPAEQARVRDLVARLDRPPRRLLIELRQSAQQALSSRGIEYGATGRDLSIGQPPGGVSGMRHHSVQTRSSGHGTKRVQALEGRPALIRAGVSVPVYQGWQQVQGGRVFQGFQVDYRDTSSGFYALPRVHGDRVTVEIHQQHETPRGMLFETQAASTVLQGGLGEWMDLASIGGHDQDRDDRIGRHVRTLSDSDRRLQLRVLAVD